MTPDHTHVDWKALSGLPILTAEAGDLDVVELIQHRLIPPRLRLKHSAPGELGSGDSMLIRDVEATPLLLGTLESGLLTVQSLRPVASTGGTDSDDSDEPTELAVIVRGQPDPADMVRVDALIAPRTRVAWLVLTGRTRAGRALLGGIPDMMGARPRGMHRMIRVPWPAPGSCTLFERPGLPAASRLAEAYLARHYVVVGDGPGDDQPHVGRGGTVVFFTGLSGSGKSTVARALHDALEHRSSREVTLLDGDDVRRKLSAGLGFDPAGRAANVERVSWVAALLARHGGIAITALIAPFIEGRTAARAMAADHSDFLLIWVSTPLDECERRDRKGLYAQARAGQLTNFTGIDSPYEAPDDADLVTGHHRGRRQRGGRAGDFRTGAARATPWRFLRPKSDARARGGYHMAGADRI